MPAVRARSTSRTAAIIPWVLPACGWTRGAACDLEVPGSWRAFVYVVEGSGRIGAEGARIEAGQVAWFDPSGGDGPDDAIKLAAETPLHAVLFSGPPIDEPVVAYGPFVMTTQDEIRQAFADYQSGELV